MVLLKALTTIPVINIIYHANCCFQICTSLHSSKDENQFMFCDLVNRDQNRLGGSERKG